MRETLPVNGGFNGKLVVHKGFQSLTLVYGEYRPGCIAVYKECWTAMPICVQDQ